MTISREEIRRVRDLTHRATSPFMVLFRDGNAERQAEISATDMWMLCDAAERGAKSQEDFGCAEVTEEMVNAAMYACGGDKGAYWAPETKEEWRAALEAALTHRRDEAANPTSSSPDDVEQ